MFKFFKYSLIIFLAGTMFACGSKRNVIEGTIKYSNKLTHLDTLAEGANVYLYKSLVELQDHKDTYLKKTVTGSNGFYSLFDLANGPYYVYSEKTDSNGKVLYLGGASTNVTGHETQLLNLTIH